MFEFRVLRVLASGALFVGRGDVLAGGVGEPCAVAVQQVEVGLRYGDYGVVVGGGLYDVLELPRCRGGVAEVGGGEGAPEAEALQFGVGRVELFGLFGEGYCLAVAVCVVEVVDLQVVVFDALVAGYELAVVFVVAYEVGEVGVGEAAEDHVAIVVGLRCVALAVVDAVEHVERLHDVVVVGVVAGKAQVAFEGAWSVVDAVVVDVGGAEECGGRERVERVELLLRCGEVFEVVGHVVRVVGVAVF